MKGATEELSTTVIAIVAIAAILAIFTIFLLPMLRSQIALTQACNSGPGYKSYHEGTTQLLVECEGAGTNGSFECKYYNEDGNVQGSKTCTQK